MNLSPSIFLLAALGIAATTLAQSLSPILDPVCGRPSLTLRGAESSEVYDISATDDLGSPGVWEALVRLAPGTQEHTWFDPDTLARGRRFYRVERAEPTPEVQVANFGLLDQRGVRRELFREGDAAAVVLVFTDNAHLMDTWAAVKPLHDKFKSQGVLFWLVNPRDSRVDLNSAAANLEIPVLHDEAQIVTRTYGASTSLESVAVSQSDLTVFYRGALADRCELPGGLQDQPYLEQALSQFLTAKPVVIQAAKSRGTSLALPALAVASYSQEIAPLLQAKCVTCHRPGDIGSWAMTNHTVVMNFADSIRRQVLSRQMPPWHADPAHGRFANDSSLNPAETQRLIGWLEAGAPRGEGSDPLALNPPPPAPAWPLGTPDLVLSIATQSLPASGEIPYRYLIVNSPLKTNVWLKAATVRPGNREVVHHSLVFTARTVTDFLQVQGGLGGFFAAYVPGTDAVEFPSGTGKLLKAGSYLVFQMHYTPNGKTTTDKTEIGLYFASAPPARELLTTAAYNTNFEIPAGARDHEVIAEALIERTSLLYEMSPHMHYRGARMRFEALFPDGTQETILSVPGYEFAWQTLFRLAEPKRLPAGTRIRVTGGFDNSIWNPWNPNPQTSVSFGEQTDDEMLIGYLNLAVE